MDKKNDLIDSQINALVDDQVPAHQRADLEARLASDPLAQETVHAWREQRDALRALHRPVLDEAVPAALLTAARIGQRSHQQLDQWWRWGGMAASVLLAFGMGWLANTQWVQRDDRAAQSAMKNTGPSQGFVKQASLAHSVFSPEVRHPVEVTAAEQAHLVAWLSKRLGKQLKVPNLSAQGFDLVGGRLLPGDASADAGVASTRAQFMFQNLSGTRITLYLGAVGSADSSNAANANMTRQTAFKFAGEGAVPSFYWVDQGFGYALSGSVNRDVLLKLAEVVYAQL